MEITSKEMIKPSSPTPNHLRIHKLSRLDQITLPSYIPMIFFYGPNHHPKLQVSALKKSLSIVLTEFYPLAGRLSREKYTVDCDDSGALFVEYKAEGNVFEVIKDPTMDELQKYLPDPVESSNGENDSAVVLAIQINLFDCGGIAVAVQMHHNVGDGNSLVSFLNAWAAVSRGGGDDHDQTFSPTFDLANVFPPKDTTSSGSERPKLPVMTEKTVSKRLVFGKKDLENLKLRASKVIKDPTRVEAVSSFLLKHFRDASIARGCRKRLTVVHGVNLRPRMDPPLPNLAFGNAVYAAMGSLPDDDVEGDLVDVLRKAIRKVNGDFVKEVQVSGDGYVNSLKNMKAVFSKGEPWFFSSWTRFPFYEVDYGWGRPVWVVPIAPSYKNLVILLSTSSEDGIEAWVNLLEQDADFIDFSL